MPSATLSTAPDPTLISPAPKPLPTTDNPDTTPTLPAQTSDAQEVQSTNPPTKKRKRAKRPGAKPKQSSTASLPLPRSPWSYIYLTSTTTSPPPGSSVAPLDALTARTHLTSALAQFLGHTGAAIPIDILHLDGADVWIRVPREDGRGVVAAVGGWVGKGGAGWRVRTWGEWSGSVVFGGAEGGRDLFEGEAG